MGIELLQGIGYLHSQSVIYADLKPKTVLMNEYNKLKLSDFGLAKKTTDFEHQSPGRLHGTSGSPYYMAPELFQEGGVYSFASDLWSLGCMLFEFAVGKPPFYSNSLNKVMRQL